ncbi:MAG: aldehyde dehydrogenase family protein [Acidobacteriota bacterium]|nr:aldehyde dehydrogenase family protein [Acidobacteriota bacterium]
MVITQAFDGELIAEIASETSTALEKKISRATEAFADRKGWLLPFQRIEVLRRLARLVHRDSAMLAMLIAREGGKPLTDAQVEVSRAINGVEGAISDLQHLAGKEIPMGLTAAAKDRWAFTTTEPIGLVAAISAFNHPLNLIVHQVVPAIATGCPVIVKPAVPTPLTCLHFVELVREAGLPEPWCQTLVTEDIALSEQFATDPRVAFLSFIGSAKVGWHLRSRVSPGTRVALEHGGSAPVIIHSSAGLDAVIEPLVKGGFYHAGQVCVSVQRIFIHETLKRQFVDRLTDRVRALRVGDPTLADTEVGPLIAPRELTRVGDWVEEARTSGAEITTGGHPISERLYEPTVIVEPDPLARVSRQEVFGPAVCVYGYTHLDEAIARGNSLPYAFQAAVFSQDIDAALHAARLLDASAVMINDHTAFRTDWMPFAGRRQSGFGTGGIPYTMRDMTQDKMIVLKMKPPAQ